MLLQKAPSDSEKYSAIPLTLDRKSKESESLVCIGVRRIFSNGGNSGFFLGVTKRIFSSEANSGKIPLFSTSKTNGKTFFTKN